MKREALLTLATELTNGKRDEQYGTPGANMLRTARLWSAYTGYDITPEMVAAMMVLVKISRLRHDPSKADSWVDVAGYAACGAEVCGAEIGEK